MLLPLASSLLEDDPVLWLFQHRTVAIWIGGFCLWVSLTLILRLWILHRRASFLRKFIWSIVLWIPFFGWIFYLGGFHIPGDTDIPLSESAGD